MRPIVIAAASLLIASVFTAFAQTSEQVPEFDAVSIKLSTGAAHGPPNSDGGPGTRYPEWFGTNSTLRMLMSRAYGLINAEKQISGPAWIDGQQFAVDARVPAGTSKEQFQEMLQKLLAERFGLVVHHETTMLPVYQLVVAKNGPKLKPSVAESGDDPPVSGDHDPDGFPQFNGPGFMARYGPGLVCHMKAQQQTMAALAWQLDTPNGAGRTVVDKTGLTGKYDFTLLYDIERPGSAAPEELSLSIFEALQQQLGLRLVDAKESVDLIVIDHAEKTPTDN